MLGNFLLASGRLTTSGKLSGIDRHGVVQYVHAHATTPPRMRRRRGANRTTTGPREIEGPLLYANLLGQPNTHTERSHACAHHGPSTAPRASRRRGARPTPRFGSPPLSRVRGVTPAPPGRTREPATASARPAGGVGNRASGTTSKHRTPTSSRRSSSSLRGGETGVSYSRGCHRGAPACQKLGNALR